MKIYEESIIKKKGNFTWIVTVISFLTVNLQYLWFWYSWFGRLSFNDSFIGTSPHLSALLAIDLIAIALHSQKKSTFNWKVIFILLFMFNLIFYVHMLSWITNPHLSPYFSLALLGAFPYFLILSVIDFIAVFIKNSAVVFCHF
jgi:hypothetical protein